MRPLDEPIICPIIVGRDLQIGLLQGLVDSAQAGRGQTVLITGEAGIGKSRLVGATREFLGQRVWGVLQGNFFEPDRALPYAGLADLVRAYIAGVDSEQASRLLVDLPELARLVPGTARLQGNLAPESDLDPSQDKRRLFQAFGHLATGLSALAPLLVVLEDLHWADETSLELLLFFARLVPAHRIVLLLTYRPDEMHPALAHFLSGLDRERLASEVPLVGLSASEVERMLRVILGRSRPIRSSVLHTIHQLTDGNPFFVEEIVRSMTGAGVADVWDRGTISAARIPRSVQESVQRRSRSLSSAARTVLELAAVAGRRFDFPLLLGLSDLDEAGLVQAIKELVVAQLLVEESVDQFMFRHALTRQAVYSGPLLREKRQLHHRMAETIESVYADSLDDKYGDLGYHAFEAQDWERALMFSRLAGERASALFSPTAAVEHFTRALEAASNLNHGASVAEIIRGRGKANETLGDFDAALADYQEVLVTARSNANSRDEWQSLLDIGMLWAGRDYSRAFAYLQEASDVAQALGDQSAIAHSLNRVGNWYVNVEQPWEGIALHEQALAIFRSLGDDTSVAGTLDLLGTAYLLAGDLVRSRDWYVQAISEFDALNSRQGLASSLSSVAVCSGMYHANASVAAGPLAGGWADAARSLQVARDIDWRAGESYALWNLAFCLGPMGEYGTAIDCGRKGLEIADEIEHTQWRAAAHCANGALYLDLLQVDQALAHLEEGYTLASSTGFPFWIKIAASFLASAYVAAGRLDDATRLIEHVLPASSAKSLAQRQLGCAQAELKLAKGEHADALSLLCELVAGAPNCSTEGAVARVAKLRGDALTALGRYREAETTLTEALQTCRKEGQRSIEWRTLAALSSLHLKQGRGEDSAQRSAEARSLVEELASTVKEVALAQHYRSAALSFIPGSARAVERHTSGSRVALTNREREVAALVARGLSNRAIAESLVLSERTVETHVANGLAKLGFSSRSQIAVWVVEDNLTGGQLP